GLLNLLSSWGTSTNGTGTAPANFTANNMTFNIRNNTTPTIGAAWDVTESGSVIIVGDGTAACNFTIPSGSAVNGTVDVSNNATLTLQNSTLPVLGALASGSTVVFDGAGSQTIPAENYHHLTSSSSGSRALDAGGTIAIAGTFTKGTNSYSITGGTVDYNGTGAQDVVGLSYNNLTVSGIGTSTLQASVTIGGDLLLSGGTFDLGAFTADRGTSGGSFTIAAGCTLRIGGNGTTLPANYAATSFAPTAVIEYYGTNQTVPGGTYENLNIAGAGISITLSANVSVVGDLTVTGGTLDLGTFTANRTTAGGTLNIGSGGTLKIGGTNSIPVNYTTYTFDAASTVEYSGTKQTVAAYDYGNLTVSASDTVTLPNGGTVGIAGTFTPGAGMFVRTGSIVEYNSAGAQTVAAFAYHDLVLTGGGTKTFGSGTTKVSGALSLVGAAADAVTNTTVIEYDGTADQTIASMTYYDLTFTNAGTKSVLGAVTVDRNVVANSGTVTIIDAAGALTIHGDLDNSGIFTNNGTLDLIP
ncbi:MAG: hypothetical protein HUU02_16765, partial [Bacteroidetes bacterium]|nr:hypothetical protein [Bacteroidota bacterium]